MGLEPVAGLAWVLVLELGLVLALELEPGLGLGLELVSELALGSVWAWGSALEWE